MVDLAYAALYFSDPGMADEVNELEERLAERSQDRRPTADGAGREPTGGTRTEGGENR